MPESLITLSADCSVTIIPAGDEIILPAGTEIELVQNLGGSVTVKSRGILYRIDASEIHQLEPDQRAAMGISTQDSTSPAPFAGAFSETLLWDTLKTCYDPEIPINIVDLGLVYDLHYHPVAGDQYEVAIKMTLTAQGCGMGPVIAEDARRKIEALPVVASAKVSIVWDPPWTPHMISVEGRQQLGIV